MPEQQQCIDGVFNLRSLHRSTCGSFIAYEVCHHREFLVHISPAVQCTLFNRGFLECSPTKQDLCSKYFLTKWNSCHEILAEC